MTQTAQYNSGMQNPDGGVMEIIDYNTVTGWAYAVNGVTGNLTAIPMKNKNAVDKIALLDGKNINIKEIVENNYKGFSYGDMTSVAVSPNGESLQWQSSHLIIRLPDASQYSFAAQMGHCHLIRFMRQVYSRIW